MKARYSFLPLLLLLLLMASCRSSRHAASDDTTAPSDASGGVSTIVSPDVPKVDKLTRNTVAKLDANRQTVKGVRAKISVSLGGLSASGPLKMKRDEIIQISLSALLGIMEVGRLELTPEYFFYQDRINHQYVKARWAGVSQFRDAGINFYTFQSLFWNELFVPGQSGIPHDTDFTTEKSGSDIVVTPRAATGTSDYAIAVKFLVEAASGLIRQTSVKPVAVASLSLDCICTDWTRLNGRSFPSDMQLKMTAGTESKALRMKLSGLQTDENIGNIESPTPGSNYTHISIDRLFRRLGK